jgi:hypothetical protein
MEQSGSYRMDTRSFLASVDRSMRSKSGTKKRGGRSRSRGADSVLCSALSGSLGESDDGGTFGTGSAVVDDELSTAQTRLAQLIGSLPQYPPKREFHRAFRQKPPERWLERSLEKERQHQLFDAGRPTTGGFDGDTEGEVGATTTTTTAAPGTGTGGMAQGAAGRSCTVVYDARARLAQEEEERAAAAAAAAARAAADGAEFEGRLVTAAIATLRRQREAQARQKVLAQPLQAAQTMADLSQRRCARRAEQMRKQFPAWEVRAKEMHEEALQKAREDELAAVARREREAAAAAAAVEAAAVEAAAAAKAEAAGAAAAVGGGGGGGEAAQGGAITNPTTAGGGGGGGGADAAQGSPQGGTPPHATTDSPGSPNGKKKEKEKKEKMAHPKHKFGLLHKPHLHLPHLHLPHFSHLTKAEKAAARAEANIGEALDLGGAPKEQGRLLFEQAQLQARQWRCGGAAAGSGAAGGTGLGCAGAAWLAARERLPQMPLPIPPVGVLRPQTELEEALSDLPLGGEEEEKAVAEAGAARAAREEAEAHERGGAPATADDAEGGKHGKHGKKLGKDKKDKKGKNDKQEDPADEKQQPKQKADEGGKGGGKGGGKELKKKGGLLGRLRLPGFLHRANDHHEEEEEEEEEAAADRRAHPWRRLLPTDLPGGCFGAAAWLEAAARESQEARRFSPMGGGADEEGGEAAVAGAGAEEGGGAGGAAAADGKGGGKKGKKGKKGKMHADDAGADAAADAAAAEDEAKSGGTEAAADPVLASAAASVAAADASRSRLAKRRRRRESHGERAASLLRRSAALGYAPAQVALGLLWLERDDGGCAALHLEDGPTPAGVEPEPVRGAAWRGLVRPSTRAAVGLVLTGMLATEGARRELRGLGKSRVLPTAGGWVAPAAEHAAEEGKPPAAPKPHHGAKSRAAAAHLAPGAANVHAAGVPWLAVHFWDHRDWDVHAPLTLSDEGEIYWRLAQVYDPYLSRSFTEAAEAETAGSWGGRRQRRRKGDIGAGEGATALGSRWARGVKGEPGTGVVGASGSGAVGTLAGQASGLPRHAFLSRAFAKDALWAIRLYQRAAAAGHVGASLVLGVSLWHAGAAQRSAAVPRLLRAAAAIDIAEERHTLGNDALRPKQQPADAAAGGAKQHGPPHHHHLHMPHFGKHHEHALVARRSAPLLLEREKPFFYLAQCFEKGGSKSGGIDRNLAAAVAHYERFIELHPAINKVNGSIHAHMASRLPRGEVDNINAAKRAITLVKNRIEAEKPPFAPPKLTPHEQRLRLQEERRAHHNALCKAERLRAVGGGGS